MKKLISLLLLGVMIIVLQGCQKEARTDRYDLYYVSDSSVASESARAGGGLTFFTYRATSNTEYEIDIRIINHSGGVVRKIINEETVLDKLEIYFIEKEITPYIVITYHKGCSLTDEIDMEHSDKIRMYVYEEDYVRNEVSLDD